MYTLKSVARRSTFFGAAVAVFAATVVPAAPAFADTLNPLTERSLLLSSSAPGYVDTDGSNYSTANPNPVAGGNTPATYAPAGSGPNGKKTGETFAFRISSAANIQGFSFQYCTSAAGVCQAPGNNNEANPTYDPGDDNAAGSDGDARNGEYPTAPTGRPLNEGVDGGWASQKSDLEFVGNFAPAGAAATPGAGQFQVYVGGSAIDTTGWVFESDNLESSTHTKVLTGQENYVTISSATPITGLAAGTQIRVVFVPSETVFITNPGADEFFVKLNTYSNNGQANMIGPQNDSTPGDDSDHTVIDGGVTVANVMTDSIHITTKVLETMAFSVGTQNRDTVDIGGAGQTHGTCDPILQTNSNRLQMGDPDAEFSLDTRDAYDQHSYWRLSSNSSGGATVYYSGGTLANTVGDEIDDMQAEALSQPGTEQFGLGFANAGADTGQDTLDNNGAVTWAAGDRATHLATLWSYPFITMSSQTGAPYDALAAQPASTGYDEAVGTIGTGGATGTAKFQFHKSSLTVPVPIAQQNETVVSCATAKMRYVANIGADTPAGVYTTKINYLAAPQY